MSFSLRILVRLSINNEVAREPLDDVRYIYTELKQTGQTPGVAFGEHGRSEEGWGGPAGCYPITNLAPLRYSFVPSLNRKGGGRCNSSQRKVIHLKASNVS